MDPDKFPSYAPELLHLRQDNSELEIEKYWRCIVLYRAHVAKFSTDWMSVEEPFPEEELLDSRYVPGWMQTNEYLNSEECLWNKLIDTKYPRKVYRTKWAMHLNVGEAQDWIREIGIPKDTDGDFFEQTLSRDPTFLDRENILDLIKYDYALVNPGGGLSYGVHIYTLGSRGEHGMNKFQFDTVILKADRVEGENGSANPVQESFLKTEWDVLKNILTNGVNCEFVFGCRLKNGDEKDYDGYIIPVIMNFRSQKWEREARCAKAAIEKHASMTEEERLSILSDAE